MIHSNNPLASAISFSPLGQLGTCSRESILATIQYLTGLPTESPEDTLEYFKNVPAKFLNLPTEFVKAAIMATPEIASDFRTFDEYHAWYVGQGDTPTYSDSHRWPCIVSTYEGECFEDGHHRLHAYIAAGHPTIPVLAFDSDSWWESHKQMIDDQSISRRVEAMHA